MQFIGVSWIQNLRFFTLVIKGRISFIIMMRWRPSENNLPEDGGTAAGIEKSIARRLVLVPPVSISESTCSFFFRWWEDDAKIPGSGKVSDDPFYSNLVLDPWVLVEPC